MIKFYDLLEEVSAEELRGYLKNAQDRISKSNLGWDKPDVKRIEFSRMKDNPELVPSDMFKDKDGKYVIRINDKITDKGTAERLVWHELLHTYEYDDKTWAHGHKFSKRAKQLNNELFGGGEYVPVHGEQDKWQKWADNRNSKLKTQRLNDKEANDFIDRLRKVMKRKGFDVFKRNKVIDKILKHFNSHGNVKDLLNLPIKELIKYGLKD